MRDFLQESAWWFILEEGINFLPVYPHEIIRRHGWKLYTYSEYAKLIDTSVDTVIAKYDKDGFVFWSNCEHTFIICYNETFSPNMIRWTLMHEIAHIILGHVSAPVSVMSRVSEAERSLFEVEAQGFARRILCPSIILHDCRAIEPGQIMHLCGVTWETAQYLSEYVKRLEARGKFRAHPLEREVEKQFQAFILRFFRNQYRFDFFRELHIDRGELIA